MSSIVSPVSPVSGSESSFDYGDSNSNGSPRSALQYGDDEHGAGTIGRIGFASGDDPLQPSLTVRQAAEQRYQKRKKEKAEAKSMVHAIKLDMAPKGIKKKLVMAKSLEKKATTTRKIAKSPDDVKDPESISGMKCQLELDRQRDAEKKALKLVDDLRDVGSDGSDDKLTIV
eukprot:CAMPEP_0116864544 /NCGR_PEP_ID=MMETSP0418-20121206/24883_1 /TAXON_ID=1158023 /ORGANISM="Astrosyne radiata, Strain 13vi08-1A" /LENGTH=171 /DNA_ID=CAMNT_0004499781 /DNA_START=48 /DNA_END=563 /DNA_ORIENTATION=+